MICGGAAAQPAVTGEDDGTGAQLDQAARLLYEAGTRAYDAGRFGEALMRYQNAYQLSQRPALLYNVAVCYDRLERKEEAADAYEMFLDALPGSPRAAIARSRLDILRSALARDTAANQNAADPTDDGSGPGTDTGESSGAGDSITEPPPETSPSRTGPLVAFGIGGAGLVTFGVAALITSGRYSDAEKHCNEGACVGSELNDVDRSALIADIGLGVAVAGAAVGVILLLTGGDSGSSEHARLTPTVGTDGAGLILQGRF